MYDDALGDMLKEVESRETGRCVADGEGLMVRVDGIGFSKFTSGMDKPYDSVMGKVMQETAMRLLEESGASLVYTQSDEITLIYSPDAEIPHNGRLMKNASRWAGKATAFFHSAITREWMKEVADEKARKGEAFEYRDAEIILSKLSSKAPAFDGRSASVTREMAAAFLVWREIDARKNGALQAGRYVFGHGAVGGKSPGDIKDMLARNGIDYYREYPAHMRHGVLFWKDKIEMKLTEDELLRIPEHVRETKRNETFVRSRIVPVDIGMPFYAVKNLEWVVFDRHEPVQSEKAFTKQIVP